MVAHIFKPARTAMQSGRGKSKRWVLVYEPDSPREPEPLMGYASSADTRSQIRLGFDTQEAAEAYAKRRGIAYTVQAPHEPKVQRNAYSDNFRFDRKTPWSH